MHALASYYRRFDLPWVLSEEQDEQFKKLLMRVTGAVLLLALIISFLPVPERDRTLTEEVPERYAKLMLERRAPPPPPPPPVVEPEPQELTPEPEAIQPEPEPIPQPEPVIPEPQPDRTELARETASRAGLMAFADDLADLRDNSALQSVSQDRNLVGGAGAAQRQERSIITSKVGSGSGGISTAGLSRNTGGAGELNTRGTTRVGSPVGTGNGAGSGSASAGDGTGSARGASRTREEIEIVFSRNQGPIHSLYRRALRSNPTLKGKVVVSLTISPSGVVTDCHIVSSELNDSELERKLVQRIKLFKFEAKDVAVFTGNKPIDFLPA